MDTFLSMTQIIKLNENKLNNKQENMLTQKKLSKKWCSILNESPPNIISDALLADLQNTVPGKLKPIPGAKPHNVTFADDTSDNHTITNNKNIVEPVSLQSLSTDSTLIIVINQAFTLECLWPTISRWLLFYFPHFIISSRRHPFFCVMFDFALDTRSWTRLWVFGPQDADNIYFLIWCQPIPATTTADVRKQFSISFKRFTTLLLLVGLLIVSTLIFHSQRSRCDHPLRYNHRRYVSPMSRSKQSRVHANSFICWSLGYKVVSLLVLCHPWLRTINVTK